MRFRLIVSENLTGDHQIEKVSKKEREAIKVPEDKGWHGIIDKVMRSEPVGLQILRSREEL